MKFWPLRILVALLIITVGCSSEHRTRLKEKEIAMQPFVFHMNYFLAGNDLDFSFPVWFNDSIVRKNKIKTIRQKTLGVSAYDQEVVEGERFFNFNEQGVITSVQRIKYYENMVVENVTFSYSGVYDEKGFTVVEIIDSLNLNEASKYEYYLKELYNKDYGVYNNSITGDYLFCILNSKLCEIVSVDSLFNPTPNDIVQYGSHFKPLKRFQIENLVNEKNVTTYEYYDNSKELKSVASENYPFYNKKHVTVDNRGFCTGYVDSIFSADSYLNRIVSTFKLNKNKLPIKLLHKGMRSGIYEEFTYEYYE